MSEILLSMGHTVETKKMRNDQEGLNWLGGVTKTSVITRAHIISILPAIFFCHLSLALSQLCISDSHSAQQLCTTVLMLLTREWSDEVPHGGILHPL